MSENNQKATENTKTEALEDPMSELEKDLAELGGDIFGVKKALEDGKIDREDLPVIAKGAQDALKDGPAIVDAGKKIDDAVHDLAEDVLDNPDVVIENIGKSGLADAIWGLWSCLSWTGLGKLFSALGAILFPAPPEIPTPPETPAPETPATPEAPTSEAPATTAQDMPTPKPEPTPEPTPEPVKLEEAKGTSIAMPEPVDVSKPLVEPATPAE